MFLRDKNSAQNTTEYAIILAVVAAALTAMQVYIKRGIQGRIRNLADQISAEHYESGKTTANYTTIQNGTIEVINEGFSAKLNLSEQMSSNQKITIQTSQGQETYSAREAAQRTGEEITQAYDDDR